MTVRALLLRLSFPGTRRLFIFFLLSFGSLASVGLAQGLAGNRETNNILLMIQGTVEVARGGAGNWAAGQTNQILFPGDRVRTRERSRAMIYLTNGMTLEKSELSEFEIPPSNGVNFHPGRFHILNRDPRRGGRFSLPNSASMAIRGTDFIVHVTDQAAEVIVLDGEVELSNPAGAVDLRNKEKGRIENGGVPQKSPVLEGINQLVQWFLYYPGVLFPEEMNFANAERAALSESLTAYYSGDLARAAQTYPWGVVPLTDDGRAYRAALLLSVGQAADAEALLQNNSSAAARAVRRLMAAVRFEEQPPVTGNLSASEWLAKSYYQQSRSKLSEALAAAQTAVSNQPRFGFAWVRVAELEFASGRRSEMLDAVQRGLALSPRNAQAVVLEGFALAAANRVDDAQAKFDQAIVLDNALGNAWLGRGLCRIRRGHDDEGLRDLLVAAALEPQRSLLRSYLGKAFANRGDAFHARRELDIARRLDAADPTSWLYSALLLQESNHINEAVGDLERSRELNDNRGLYRSRLLLDQDRAVRSANLAAIYRDAGMSEVSVREASRSVVGDYANFSSHLFLANSYAEQTDPNLVSLRYETATFSEYLLANLLAPVGASTLSRNISQQEYAKLFERDRLGLSSSTFYSSQGDWQQEASQFGTIGNTAYAIEGIYRSFNGTRPNNDLEQTVLSAQFKQQLTVEDSIYFQAIYDRSESGDLGQYYNHSGSANLSKALGVPRPDRRLRTTQEQEPNVFLGYHHEWSPGVHTLFLAARLDAEVNSTSPSNSATTLYRNANGQIFFIPNNPPDTFASRYEGRLAIYSAELQQLWQTEKHIVIAGARLQAGDFDGRTRFRYLGFRPTFDPDGIRQKVDGDFEHETIYAYHNWRVLELLWLSAGVSYDHLAYPENAFVAPISGRERGRDQVSPKAGFIWMPAPATSVRGAYTRSLGGFSYDQSVRLEPTEVAGFNQAFRSLFPEALVGSVPGIEFETFNVGVDHQFATRTYGVLEASLLRARGEPRFGAFEFVESPGSPPAGPAQVRQKLRFEEQSLNFSLHQLLGDCWSVGSRYRLSQAELKTRQPEIPNALLRDSERRALLHQVSLFAIYNHPSGFFSRAESLWWPQSNHADDAILPGDDFWQFNLFAGYRFPRRRAEIVVGLLNITDQNYRLNPLNLYSELARERTLTVNFKFNF